MAAGKRGGGVALSSDEPLDEKSPALQAIPRGFDRVGLAQRLADRPITCLEAAKLLEGIGLNVYETQGSPLDPVSGTRPAVGTAVLYGKSVVLVTG